jgi:hypothetical protein
MKFKFFKAGLASVILSAACLVNVANAGLIGFESVSDAFWIDGVVEDGFAINRTDDGLASLGASYTDSYWNGNGTGRLITWTNNGSTSGIEINTLNGDLFSLNSFEFGNGYVRGNSPVTSVTLTGLLSNGSIITDSFSSFGNNNLSNAWVNLTSVKFIANGTSNRAYWDNIEVNRVSVPEPSTLAIFALGMIGLASRRFKKQS